jgi:8-oxo-dGTP pyrophosphatase MutT (NUDIX family)
MTFMRNSDFIEQLTERLSRPLPGQSAQLKMTFAHRAEQLRLNPVPPPDARVAGVLLAIWYDDHEWKTLLIQRTQNPRDQHSGQVSFPGGKHEESDGDISRTAVREAHEEVGIYPENIDIIVNLLKENRHTMFLRKVDRSFPDSVIKDIMNMDFNHKIDILHNQGKKKDSLSVFYNNLPYFFILISFLASFYCLTSLPSSAAIYTCYKNSHRFIC